MLIFGLRFAHDSNNDNNDTNNAIIGVWGFKAQWPSTVAKVCMMRELRE
jgi:hypothetical protein